MAVSQLNSSLLIADGTDLDDQASWETKPSTGKFTFYNATSGAAANGIPGVYHKPPTTGPETGSALPRAFFLPTGIDAFEELKTSQKVRVRPSSSTTSKWPSAGNVNLEGGVLLRASGSDFATDKWYEVGFIGVDNQTTGFLLIRRVVAGVSTELARASFASSSTPTFKFPAYNTAAANFNNQWLSVIGYAETIGAMVRVTARLELPGGVYAQLVFDDTSSDRIVTPGFGGIFATGDAASSGSLWLHFDQWLLTADDLVSAVQPPADATATPEVPEVVVYTSLDIGNEYLGLGGTIYILDTLSPKPDGVLEVTSQFQTVAHELETGDRFTSSKFDVGRRRFRISWSALNATDQGTLETFFSSHRDICFNLQVPDITGGGYTNVTVQFVEDSLTDSVVMKGATVYKSYTTEVLEAFTS